MHRLTLRRRLAVFQQGLGRTGGQSVVNENDGLAPNIRVRPGDAIGALTPRFLAPAW
jgi:hypothetical protein